MHLISVLGLKVLGAGVIFATSSLGIIYYKNPTILGLDKQGFNLLGNPSENSKDEVVETKKEEEMFVIAEGETSRDQPSIAINYTEPNYACKYDEIVDDSCVIEKIDFGDKKWLYASSIKTEALLSKAMTDGTPPQDKELFRVKVSKALFEKIDLNDSAKKICVEVISKDEQKSYASLKPYISIQGQDIKHKKTKYKVVKASEYGSYYSSVVNIDQSDSVPPSDAQEYKCMYQKFDILKSNNDNGLEDCTVNNFSETKEEDFEQLKPTDLITKTIKIETNKHYLFEYGQEIDHESNLSAKKSTDKIFFYWKNGSLQEHIATFIEPKTALAFELLPVSGPDATKKLLIVD